MLCGIALLMTVGVYGLVAGIVKLDDGGLWLSRKDGLLRSLGHGILRAAPYLMKSLSVIGTVAMFMVGGGIITHGVATLHHGIEELADAAGVVAGVGPALEWVAPSLLNALVGVLVGAVALLLVMGVGKLWHAARG
ncbi:Inner membrane protein YedI [compost metagenome]